MHSCCLSQFELCCDKKKNSQWLIWKEWDLLGKLYFTHPMAKCKKKKKSESKYKCKIYALQKIYIKSQCAMLWKHTGIFKKTS